MAGNNCAERMIRWAIHYGTMPEMGGELLAAVDCRQRARQRSLGWVSCERSVDQSGGLASYARKARVGAGGACTRER